MANLFNLIQVGWFAMSEVNVTMPSNPSAKPYLELKDTQ